MEVAGLKIDPIRKADLLNAIQRRIQSREKTFVVTPYSEFLYASLQQTAVMNLLNRANYSIPDGIGILWAHLFLSQPLTVKNYFLRILQAWLQVVWTGAAILLYPKILYKDIPEKIVGADFIWDLARLAEQNNFKVYLLGSKGDIAKRAGEKLKAQFPNLQIVGTSNKNVNDPSIIDDINAAGPDMLFVTFNRLVQEKWIDENLSKVTASFAIALGGTFDYIAGAKIPPPKFIRKIGLEWLYRLITQPSRIVRIYQGVFGLILSLVRYKVLSNAPLRRNGAAVVVNKDGKILVCKRTPGPAKNGSNQGYIMFDYWQFPQGGLEEKEDDISGTQRELEEETSIKSVEPIGVAEFRNKYYWNNGIRPLFNRRFRFSGQDQVTVFFKFVGENSEIKLDEDELIEYKWVAPNEVVKILAKERRPHAEAVLAELAKIQL